MPYPLSIFDFVLFSLLVITNDPIDNIILDFDIIDREKYDRENRSHT